MDVACTACSSYLVVHKIFLISDFRRVLKLVCFLLGIFPPSEYLDILHPAFEDGPDRGFRNVGKT
jgi:hypothetical protein